MTKILIVEDEITIAELEKDYLEIEGFVVDIAGTGIKGLEMVNRESYNLIILDIMLPGINGFELCKKIRETHKIPLLIVSSRKEDIDKIRGLGLGADDYITKPFSPSELVARVKAHLAIYSRLMGEEVITKELRIRNLMIQPSSRRIYLNEKEIILTSTEYDLFYFLASHPEQVFTKETLLDRIWGTDYFGDGSTVTVHIGKLRDKIDKLNKGNAPFLDTVWGVGYRFHL